MDGKKKRRGAVVGKTAKTKKAIVALTEESKDIEIFEGLIIHSAVPKIYAVKSMITNSSKGEHIMGIKTYNPYTPSRRHMTGSDFSEITTSTPEKSLVVSLKKNSGRNNQGKITVRHRGGGSRRKYRIIDFKRRKDGYSCNC